MFEEKIPSLEDLYEIYFKEFQSKQDEDEEEEAFSSDSKLKNCKSPNTSHLKSVNQQIFVPQGLNGFSKQTIDPHLPSSFPKDLSSFAPKELLSRQTASPHNLQPFFAASLLEKGKLENRLLSFSAQESNPISSLAKEYKAFNVNNLSETFFREILKSSDSKIVKDSIFDAKLFFSSSLASVTKERQEIGFPQPLCQVKNSDSDKAYQGLYDKADLPLFSEKKSSCEFLESKKSVSSLDSKVVETDSFEKKKEGGQPLPFLRQDAASLSEARQSSLQSFSDIEKKDQALFNPFSKAFSSLEPLSKNLSPLEEKTKPFVSCSFEKLLEKAPLSTKSDLSQNPSSFDSFQEKTIFSQPEKEAKAHLETMQKPSVAGEMKGQEIEKGSVDRAVMPNISPKREMAELGSSEKRAPFVEKRGVEKREAPSLPKPSFEKNSKESLSSREAPLRREAVDSEIHTLFQAFTSSSFMAWQTTTTIAIDFGRFSLRLEMKETHVLAPLHSFTRPHPLPL